MSTSAKILVYTPCVAGAILFRAWVMLQAWRWFAVPLGAPSLTLAHLLALTTLWGFMTHKPKDDSDEGLGYQIAYSLFASGLMWPIFWGLSFAI